MRELFDAERVGRLLAVAEELLAKFRALNPIDGKPGSVALSADADTAF